MKTTTTIYRWTAKTSSRCLGRYYTASTLPEAIKAGKEFVALGNRTRINYGHK